MPGDHYPMHYKQVLSDQEIEDYHRELRLGLQYGQELNVRKADGEWVKCQMVAFGEFRQESAYADVLSIWVKPTQRLGPNGTGLPLTEEAKVFQAKAEDLGYIYPYKPPDPTRP